MQITLNTLYCYSVPTSETSSSEVSLCADLLVRACASRVLNVLPSDLCYQEGPHGKPSFKGYPDFHFNLSHSKNHLAVCISEAEVGVDIEAPRDISKRLIERCLTPFEIESLSTEPSVRTQEFLKLWTQKEAYLKHDGCGITRKLNTFEITLPEIKAHMQTFERKEVMLSLFCTEIKPQDFKIIELNHHDFENLTLS